MNQPMPPQQTIVVQTSNNAQSTLGTTGLIFSCLGWLTCGLLCIPGAALSFLGLFSNKLKTHAIIGLIVGFPGVLVFIFVGAAIILPLIGIGGAVATTAAAQAAKAQAEAAARQDPPVAAEMPATDEPTPAEPAMMDTEPALEPTKVEPIVVNEIKPETEAAQPAAVDPAPPAPQEPAAPAPVTPSEPPSRYRTFTDATGKYKIIAELIAVKNNWVKLQREDGKEITMPIEKLSAEDQSWVRLNPPK